jgi:hypothetical protein
MSTIEPIRISGLAEFQKALRNAGDGLQKQLRLVFNDAADIVVPRARPRLPRRTGALQASLRASSGQRDARVTLGKAKTPYAGFIEFGGRVGRNKSVRRPFIVGGRTIYPAVRSEEAQIAEAMAKGLNRLADEAGL